MDHIEFDFFEDFSYPLGLFLDSCGIRTYVFEKDELLIPIELYSIPQ